MTRLQYVRNWTRDAWMMWPDPLIPPFPPVVFAAYDGERYSIKPMQTQVIVGRVELSRRVVLGSGEQ